MHAQLLNNVQLFVTPWTVAHQAPPSMGFSRQEYYRYFYIFFLSLMDGCLDCTVRHVRSWFPEQGLSLCPLHGKLRVFTTAPPGKSHFVTDIKIFHCFLPISCAWDFFNFLDLWTQFCFCFYIWKFLQPLFSLLFILDSFYLNIKFTNLFCIV